MSFFHFQAAQLQAMNPNAEATGLISAICGDTVWLQEVNQKKNNFLRSNSNRCCFSYSIDLIQSCNKLITIYFPM